jgi:DNA-binding SARP family transcriptional activator/tetratricopeptide (TPR) repeat protein
VFRKGFEIAPPAFRQARKEQFYAVLTKESGAEGRDPGYDRSCIIIITWIMSTIIEVITLGGLEVRTSGKLVTGFHSRKVKALLAYLAANEGPQSREGIAELLWPERPQRQSLSNLRVVLADLKKILGNHLDIQRDKIGLHRNSSLWIDLNELKMGLDDGQLVRAVRLYRGDFLQGFYVHDSREFENWIFVEREKQRRKVLNALQNLVTTCCRKGEYGGALSFAERIVELDKLNEPGRLELIRLLALTGQRTSALEQFAAYRCMLKEELGIDPSIEMMELVSQLQSGGINAALDPPFVKREMFEVIPELLEQKPRPSPTSRIPFVGRERELEILETQLCQVYNGRGTAIFVAGEAGSGKTTLVREFVGRSLETHPELLAVSGSCTVFSGTGDPFLPFRDVFAQLLGDVEKGIRSGSISPEQEKRLGEFRSEAIQIILELGKDLNGGFIPERWTERPGKTGQVSGRKESEPPSFTKTIGGSSSILQPDRTFEQYAEILVEIALHRPLLVILDDLHWADPSSISLLSHLSSRLISSPIMVIGTFRPEEATGVAHAFGKSLWEFTRRCGHRPIDLDHLDNPESEKFIDALIDLHPNQLDERFRRRLARLTGGNALFTVELLHDLKERGLLVQEKDGLWIEGGGLSWEILPARVEAILERRASHLADEMVSALEVASIQGEEFSAEVIAQVLGMDILELLRGLRSKTVRESRLVDEVGLGRAASRPLSLFRFRHGLFQKYFYDRTGEAGRAYLHERVGRSLEGLFQEDPETLAASSSQLAWHFQEASLPERAIGYLKMAGDRAMQLGASQEAVDHFRRGIELLPDLNRVELRCRKEIELQLSLCAPLQVLKGYADPEVCLAYERVRDLSAQMEKGRELLPYLYFLRTFHYTQAERQATYQVAEEIFDSPEELPHPCLLPLAWWAVGSELSYQGDFQRARRYLEQAAESFDGKEHHWLIPLYGNDPGIASLSRLSWVLWFLGYPDQAREYSRIALSLAEGSNNPFVKGFAVGRAGVMFNQIMGEVQAAHDWNKRSREASEKDLVKLFSPAERILSGWVKAEMGEIEEGIDSLSLGLREWRASRSEMHLPHYLGLYASALLRAGQAERGLEAIEEALSVAQNNNERYYAAELHRVRGEFLLLKGEAARAEAVFQEGIEIARIQEAKSLELRTAISLSRLWRSQGNRSQALDCITNLYSWFSEGFDTPDLRAARDLITMLE